VARPRKKESKSKSAYQRYVNNLIYGPAGHGKTYMLGTAVFDERTCPIAILDFEGGVLDVLTGLPGEGTDWVHMPIRTWSDFNEAYDRLYTNDEGFKSAGVDSVSETHIFALLNLLEDGKPSRQSEPDLIQQGDYGVALVQLRRLVRAFRDLPMHTFFTSHYREEKDPREGLVKIPSLAGKAAIEIPGLMTVVGYLSLSENEEGETERVLLLQNYAKIRTKVRMPWGVEAPDEIVNPTVTSLFDALHV
jgi:hypothetical protein